MTSVNFACKKVNLKDILKCSFNLNKSEYKLLLHLLEQNNSMTASQTAQKLELDRTTIQKAIKPLLEKGLVERVQENLPRGSYVFKYKAKPKNEIKLEVKSMISKWCENVEKEMNRF